MNCIAPTSNRSRQAGFNIAELLVSMTLLLTAGVVGTPPLAGYLQRSKLEGAAFEMSTLMRASRSIAITRGSTTVVRLDPSTGELVAFADLHGETPAADPDGIFDPIAGRPERLTDYEIGRIRLPGGISFSAPDGTTGVDSVEGFNNLSPLPDDVAIFLEDGSLESPGAFRLADSRGNYLELIATSTAATRVEVLKWDGRWWLSRGARGAGWTWK
jgi:hypothetical protein